MTRGTRHALAALIISLCATAAFAAADALRLRADRAFEWDDYAGSSAMYEVLISRTPDDSDLYARAIVSRQMLGDTLAAVDLMQRAMAHGLGLGDMLGEVKSTDFAKGRAELYAAYLVNLRNAMPWMERALDNQLLEYYDFRNDGPMIERYARIMLAPLPQSTHYLNLLARGLMLQNRLDEAAEVWHRILEIDPADATAATYLEAAGR
ncbi:MAG: hypothetical protein K2M19_00690 [Muribaculaceae bacterium]|nr:hypothetical protein [Muribaculaceae bacterium]